VIAKYPGPAGPGGPRGSRTPHISTGFPPSGRCSSRPAARRISVPPASWTAPRLISRFSRLDFAVARL